MKNTFDVDKIQKQADLLKLIPAKYIVSRVHDFEMNIFVYAFFKDFDDKKELLLMKEMFGWEPFNEEANNIAKYFDAKVLVEEHFGQKISANEKFQH